MKLLAILLSILIFGPSIWDLSLIAGRKAPVPTPVYPTRVYDALRTPNAGKVVLQVPPTSVVWRDHNNAALSGPTISVPTEHPVTSYLAPTEIGDLVTKLHPHGTRELCRNVQHWWRINSTWAIKWTSLVYYLFALIAVRSGLLQKHAVHHRNLRSEPVTVSALDPTGTLVHRTSGQLVTSKQPNRPIPWISIYLAEGVLSMHPCCNRSGLVQWSILFQPQQHRFPAYLITRVVIDGRLFNVPLHGISNYHPWAPHIACGFNVPWKVVKKSGEVNATAIVLGAATTPATVAQTIANLESEASAPLALIEDSNDACRVGEAEQVTQETAVNSPPPSRPASPGFTSEHEAPITQAADPLPPSTRFDTSYPDAIHSFNGSLRTRQYIAWLHLTRPAQPLPNRTVPADQAAVVRSHLRPTLRGLADRAGERHPPRPRATTTAESDSEEGHVMAEEAGPSVVEDQPGISATEEGSSGTSDRGPKPHRAGKRTARMKRQARAREAAAAPTSDDSEGPTFAQLAALPSPSIIPPPSPETSEE
ncbi:hypothetical protein FS837_009917 [Tulasnella sp. UAMH 9824]|nr:hypothetical protein FS837_009917 [Tulasnella sp. UAMH 9824]